MLRSYIVIIVTLMFTVDLASQSGEEICLTKNQWNDRYASYSPKGDFILYESDSAGNWDIFIMDFQGKQRQQLTTNTADDRRPCWHPKGTKILFESDRDGKSGLYVFNLKNRKIRKLSKNLQGKTPLFAAYNPTGKKIAVSLQESESKSNIIILKHNGKRLYDLTNNEFRNFYPRWSPDGIEIIFFSRKDTNNEDDEIYSTRVGSGTFRRLTKWPTHNFCPDWSPDQKRMVYVTSMPDTRPEIYIMNTDGSGSQRITYNEDGETLPSWHPIENKILITAYRNGNYEICALTIRGEVAH